MKKTSTQKIAVAKTVEIKTEQKLKETLEKKQEQLQNIFLNAPAAIAIFEGLKHKYVLANKAYEKLSNRKAADLLGKSMHDLFPELKGTGIQDLFDNVLKTGESFSAPEHALMIDLKNEGVPRQFYFNFSMQPLKNDSGEIYAVMAITYDITEQVEARKRSEESEKKFEAAILAVQGIIWTNNADGKMIGEQLGWANLTGQLFEEYQDFGWVNAIHPDDAQLTVDAWDIAVANQSIFVFEHRVNTKQNGWRIFSVRGVPVLDKNGKVQQWVGVHTDISQQREAEQNIKENEKRQAFLLKLSDAMRPLQNSIIIEEVVTKMTLDFLDADWCYFGTIEKDNVIVLRDALRGNLPSVAGVYPINNFALFKAILDTGRPFVVDDVQTETNDLLDEDLILLCVQLQIISFIAVPVIKNDKPVALLALVQSKPRKWTESEVQLVLEIAERTWVALERSKAEEELAKSEKKYRNLFTSIDQGFVLCELIRNEEGKGIDYYILELNPNYEKQSGISKEMVLGKTVMQIFPEMDTLRMDIYAAVVDNQCPAVFDHYLEYTKRWYEVNAYPGEKDKFVVLFSDITARKQAEEKIKESEFRYHEMIYSSPSQICILKGEDLIIEIANDAILEGWGKGKNIIGKSLITVLPEIVEQGFDKLLLSVYETGEPVYAYETPVTLVRNEKPELMHYTFVYQAQRNVNGVIKGVAIIATEVTSQAAIKQKIKESESRFRLMADASPVLIWTLDADGLSSYYNKTFRDFIGVSEDENISDWKKIVHPDDIQFLVDAVNRAIAQCCSYSSECRLLRADGQWRWVMAQGNPRLDDDDKFLGFVGSSVDITERKQAVEELIKAKVAAENVTNSKQQFLSNMSHEIRTPLNSIIGFANVLLKTELGEEQKEFLQAIKTSGKSLNFLINDILDLAKVDAGKMTFEKQPFELRKSIISILHSFDLKIKEKNLEFIKKYDTKLPNMILGDSLRLNQIILNLVSNAIKFTHKGKITLSVNILHEDQDNVTLEFAVTDTGIGIAANKINTIFNVFEQAEFNTSNSYGGTGLGLAIVKQLVEFQGGSISVKSKLDEGSAFSFILPFEKTIQKPEEIEILKPNLEIKNLRILVAEDVALNQLLIKIILSDFGFQYEIVDNGKIAIEKMQSNTYDIILMDLQMPEINGFEATEYIRNTLKSHIPIIALTADVTTVDVFKCKEFGMDDYISKPINEDLLYSKIVELVKKNNY